MTSVRTLALAACVLALSHAAVAQQSVDYASISGRVTDRSGAVLPGARIIVRHVETNLTSVAVTGQDGRFRIPYLRVGAYEITATRDGFRDVTRRLTLTAGAAYEWPVSLMVAGVESAVTVTAETSVLEANRSQVAGTVSRTEVASLPLNGRSFLDIALLVPGVSPTNVNSTQMFPETSAVPGISLSVGSSGLSCLG